MSAGRSDARAPDLLARDALVERQGKGARYDAPNAPDQDLLHARRGAAFFARKLNDLTNDELQQASGVKGWSRAQLIADISYSARILALSLENLRNGNNQQDTDWLPDLALAATLPSQAIRSLYIHSDVHLNVEFRDLREENWEMVFSHGPYVGIAVRSAPALRAKALWLGAQNLVAV